MTDRQDSVEAVDDSEASHHLEVRREAIHVMTFALGILTDD